MPIEQLRSDLSLVRKIFTGDHNVGFEISKVRIRLRVLAPGRPNPSSKLQRYGWGFDDVDHGLFATDWICEILGIAVSIVN